MLIQGQCRIQCAVGVNTVFQEIHSSFKKKVNTVWIWTPWFIFIVCSWCRVKKFSLKIFCLNKQWNVFVCYRVMWINCTDSFIPMILCFGSGGHALQLTVCRETGSRPRSNHSDHWLHVCFKTLGVLWRCLIHGWGFSSGATSCLRKWLMLNSRWFSINSCQPRDNLSRDAAAIKREPKQYDRSQTGNLGTPEDVCWQLPR